MDAYDRVWLGLDHGWGGDLRIFETMVFLGDASNLACERYATEVEAAVGHQEMCDRVLNGEFG